jgi:hypothetical protein
MKNKKSRFCLIEKTIFPFDILIAVSTLEEIIKYIEKNKNYDLCDEEKEKLEMQGNGKAVMLKGGQTIIRLKPQKTSLGIDIADLAHEIEHAVFFICDKIGIKHTDDSDEVFAYYQAFITREALKFFQK